MTRAGKREPLIVEVPTALALLEAGKLSKEQRRLLDNMDDAPRRGWDGIIPHGIGQQSAMAALVRRGLARYVGEAGCGECDGPCRPDVEKSSYDITDAGRAVLAALRAG